MNQLQSLQYLNFEIKEFKYNFIFINKILDYIVIVGN